MHLTLHVWRQDRPEDGGRMVRYEADDISPDMSFLEMLDVVNERLIEEGQRPIEFEHDCREGICGSCGFVINGVAHGPRSSTALCQLHMREFSDGDELYLEPWRATAFPALCDLVVDRSAFDRIIQAGGYVSVNTGSAPEANLIPVPHDDANDAFDAAACIGCGACVAQCPNGAAHLFTSAKIAHLALLPQGQAERLVRVLGMVTRMEEEGFGSCSNYRECEAVCPKDVSIRWIARMNRNFIEAKVRER